jgi:hypothetical protein
MANTIRASLQRLFLLISVLCSPLTSLAQVSETFSDMNFSHNPEWFGDINQFTISDKGQLQLKSEGAGNSYLSTINSCINNTEWQFYIRLPFSPSANNNARVYLTSDQSDLSADLNGYFIQFGESGSADAIELFRQNGQELTSICRGTASLISKSFELKIKVLHQTDGNWEIEVDPLDGTGFLPEANGFDNELPTSNYFGFYCKYTKSNSQKMYFDDVFIHSLEPIITDSIPPHISNLKCLSETILELSFSEEIKMETALEFSNYTLNDESQILDSIQINQTNDTLLLHFNPPFINGKSNAISIQNLTDTTGNVMKDTTLYFTHFEAEPLDITINEIMDDPTPGVGLEEFEYLELLNHTEFDINLNGWSLQINERVKYFDEAIIPANAYIIICGSSAKEAFSDYGLTTTLSGFLLPNSGSQIVLRNKKSVIISNFSYIKNDFKNSEKDNGGWSIEQIDHTSICLGTDNWAYSINPNGGSPGQLNSVNKVNKPIPEIEVIERLNDNMLRLTFSNSMDTSSILKLANYEIIETGTNPIVINLINDDQKTIEISFSSPFSKNQFYTLSVSADVQNCLGNKLPEDYAFSFAIPDEINYGDIIINEILFQPLNGGEEYIELYNRSHKFLDFSDLKICLIKDDFPHPPDTNCQRIVDKSKLFFPTTYFVISRSPEKVLEQYYTPNPDHFIEMPDLPKLNDDGAIIALKSPANLYIDFAEYNKNMHYPLLNFTQGVSLEKINYDFSGLIHDNWVSASFESGFGTPSYENSQFINFQEEISPITISPHVFTPNNDGRDDLLKIEYHLVKSGYTANIIIFNSNGVKIRNLVSNELMGTEGIFSWNGLNDESEKMPRGIYIVFIELFDLQGNIDQYKETVVLGEAF